MMDIIRPGTQIDFMKYNRITIGLSVVFIAVCLVSLIFVKGINYGIDFTGGTEVQAAFNKAVMTDDVRSALDPLGLADAVIQSIGIAGSNEFLIRVPNEGKSGYVVAQKIENTLKSAFGKEGVSIRGVNMVGSAVSADLKQKGFFSMVYAGIALLIYIWFRFELSYSFGAILALLHDVIAVVGLFSITGKEMSLTVIAAVLTIIGFSLNDTIVIFDRIRENLKKGSGPMDYTQLLNSSLSQTLSRTIITSLTVFITVVCLFFFGGSVIHDFAFAMLVGVISGAYSTVFIATPVLLLFNRDKK